MTEKTNSKLKKLEGILKDKNSLLILMQDNPDPDSIAAALALKKLANSLEDIKCSIAHGGTVGRAENRALVHYLNLNMHLCNQIVYDKYDLIGMVDTQPCTGNNSLPENIVPDIVFDHHPMKQQTRSAKFFDVRSKCGATSTILFEYLLALNVEIDVHLATALLYAIRSDTQDLGREASHADIDAVTYLFPIANKRMLGEIQRGSVPREYFIMLAKALESAHIYGNSIVTHLGNVSNPDMIGEVADLLLREDHILWAMCTGIFKNKLLISLRTMDHDNRADKVIKCVVANKGTGGGHLTYSGGQIPVNNSNRPECARLEKLVSKRFLKVLGIDEKNYDVLVVK